MGQDYNSRIQTWDKGLWARQGGEGVVGNDWGSAEAIEIIWIKSHHVYTQALFIKTIIAWSNPCPGEHKEKQAAPRSLQTENQCREWMVMTFSLFSLGSNRRTVEISCWHLQGCTISLRLAPAKHFSTFLTFNIQVLLLLTVTTVGLSIPMDHFISYTQRQLSTSLWGSVLCPKPSQYFAMTTVFCTPHGCPQDLLWSAAVLRYKAKTWIKEAT